MQETNGAKAAFIDNVWVNCGKRDETAMRRWIDELSFGMRVVLAFFVVAIAIAVLVWDVIEKPF